jgi:GcrA cell cycle regulator
LCAKTGIGPLPPQTAESQDMTIPHGDATRSTLNTLEENLMRLTQETCRWPIGDPREPGFRFCLAVPGIPGGSYCAEHQAKAFVKSRNRPTDQER